MFYTYLRGLVVLLLWSINGNAHYHNTDKIPNQDENYILVAPHRTLVGSSLHGFCDQAKTVYLYGQKRTLHQPYLWLVDSYVWCLSY